MKVNIIQKGGHHFINVEDTSTLYVDSRFNDLHEVNTFCCSIKKSDYENFQVSYITYHIKIGNFNFSISSYHPLDDATIYAALQEIAAACEERAPRQEHKPHSPEP